MINHEASSRNQHHFAAFAQVKELLGSRPLVLDREFSYLELLETLVTEGVNFVIGLKTGPHFYDRAGNLVELSVPVGKTRIINRAYYKSKVLVNVIGVVSFACQILIVFIISAARDGQDWGSNHNRVEVENVDIMQAPTVRLSYNNGGVEDGL